MKFSFSVPQTLCCMNTVLIATLATHMSQSSEFMKSSPFRDPAKTTKITDKQQTTFCCVIFAKESSFSLFSGAFFFFFCALSAAWHFQPDHLFYLDSTKHCSRFSLEEDERSKGWKRKNGRGIQELCHQIDMKRAFIWVNIEAVTYEENLPSTKPKFQ